MIKAYGFIQTFGEACIYKKVSGSSIAFLILYVDDILLIGNDIEFLDSIKGYLNKSFSMKDLGEAAYILGIKIYRDRSRHLVGHSQGTHVDKVLKKFLFKCPFMLSRNSISFPINNMSSTYNIRNATELSLTLL